MDEPEPTSDLHALLRKTLRHFAAAVGGVESATIDGTAATLMSSRPGPHGRTVMTMGLSEWPVVYEDGSGEGYIELCMRLPAALPFDEDTFSAAAGWPYREMMRLADQARETFLWPHPRWTVFDRGEPLAPETPMTAWLAVPEGGKLDGLIRPDGESVTIWALYPLHAAEAEWVRELGPEPLLQEFLHGGVSPILDPARPSLFGSAA